MAIVVLLGGKANSGKSAVKKHLAHSLVNKYGQKASVIAFADPLKYLVSNYYGITVPELNDNKEFYRHDLQQLGTEVVREQYRDDFWAKICCNRIKNRCSHEDEYFLIDDARFPNEIEIIKSTFPRVVTLWVDADKELIENRVPKHKQMSEEARQHTSELSLDKDTDCWDLFYNNHVKLEDTSWHEEINNLAFEIINRTI